MIDVDISGPALRGFPRAAIAEFVREVVQALKRVRGATFPVSEVSIHFANDDEMRRLNRTYRGLARTTDDLTFEAAGAEESASRAARPLGDIVISLEQAARQAADERHSLVTEVRYLIVHGVIHAFGYDHENDQGEMNALELKVRNRVGLQ